MGSVRAQLLSDLEQVATIDGTVAEATRAQTLFVRDRDRSATGGLCRVFWRYFVLTTAAAAPCSLFSLHFLGSLGAGEGNRTLDT